jgi:hypothetical protein
VDARGVVGAAAVAEGDLPALEMAEETGPFLICRGPVFPGGAQGPAAGDEGPVAVDDLLGVDRLWRSQISELPEYPCPGRLIGMTRACYRPLPASSNRDIVRVVPPCA